MSVKAEPVTIEVFRLRCDNCGMLRDSHSMTADAARAGGLLEGWVINRNEKAEDWCPKCLEGLAEQVP